MLTETLPIRVVEVAKVNKLNWHLSGRELTLSLNMTENMLDLRSPEVYLGFPIHKKDLSYIQRLVVWVFF